MNQGMGGHQSHKMLKDEWITPKHIIDAFGVGYFDLDPCAAVRQPWSCARKAFTVEQDGLAHNWWDNVWLNPPYGDNTGMWLSRLVEHGSGVALIFARTETADWFKYIWSKASAVLFIEGRLYFHHVDGTRAAHNAGAPSALIAYGQNNAQALLNSGIKGKLVYLDQNVLVETSGGVVNCVHSNNPTIKADILDWDEFNGGAVVSQAEADEMYKDYKKVMPFDLLGSTDKPDIPLQTKLFDLNL
jgi:hypothetical protein